MITKNLNCKTIAAIEKIDSIINKHKEAIELMEKLKISTIKKDIEKRRAEDDS